MNLYDTERKSGLREEKLNYYAWQWNKFERYFKLLSIWMEKLEDGQEIKNFFESNKYKRIAIYGYTVFCRHIIKQLQGTDIEVVCIIDKNGSIEVDEDVPLVAKEDFNETVDVIIVTIILSFDKVQKELSVKSDSPVKSLEELISCI